MMKRGLTIIEINLIIISTAVLIVLTSCGLGRARKESMLVQDSTQVSALQKGFQIYTTSNNGRYPIPGLEARLAVDGGNFVKGRGKEDLTQNDHAAVLSLAIMQELFTVDNLIAPTEQSEFVYLCENYDYQAWNGVHNGDEWTLWDDSFVNDLNVASNNSYGIMPVSGKRKRNNWCISSHSPTSFAVIGTRGPINGDSDPASKSYLMHGNEESWKGVAAFGDGHVEVLRTFYPVQSTYTTTDSYKVADNIFLEEQDQEIDADYMPGGLALGQGADIVLTHVKSGDAIAKGKGGAAVAFLHD